MVMRVVLVVLLPTTTIVGWMGGAGTQEPFFRPHFAAQMRLVQNL